MQACLAFLGKAAGEPPAARLLEPTLLPGDPLPLQLRHPHRWSRTDVTRVIVGSYPAWADVVLRDDPPTIRREHIRFYLPHATPKQTDCRAMKDCRLFLDGQPQRPLAWLKLRGGETLQLGSWLFRYEWKH